jgi:DNA segregation ATPase FtsK/SpoIIIE-like protein
VRANESPAGKFDSQFTVDMARAQKSNKTAQGLSHQVSRALREGALVVFGVLALILWYALFTYDASDPGFSQVTSTTDINNGIGRVGAAVADLLFNFFGRPAYLFTSATSYEDGLHAAYQRVCCDAGDKLRIGNLALLARGF